jgi:hypothetical protein
LATYIAHLNKPIRSLNELYRQYRDKFPSGGEVDNQIAASNPYNRQIAWIPASQDSVDMLRRAMRHFGNAHSVGDKTIDRGQ